MVEDATAARPQHQHMGHGLRREDSNNTSGTGAERRRKGYREERYGLPMSSTLLKSLLYEVDLSIRKTIS